MTAAPDVLLLVAPGPGLVDAARAEAESGGAKLVVAANEVMAAHYWQHEHPLLVVLGEAMSSVSALSFAASMRSRPAPTDPFVVLVERLGESELRARPLPPGIDEVLGGPLWPSELEARLRLAQRWREVRASLSTAVGELARMRRALDPRRAEVVGLLLRLLDSRSPGASDRGTEVAGLALKIARRFGIPPELERDLEMAAKLHEVGLLARETAPAEEGPAQAWRYVVTSRATLSELTGLQGAAELVGGIYENWDGSGFPDHLQQGQIPLRCRVLRAVLDYTTQRRMPGAGDTLAALSERAGTVYDPLVVVHLTAVVEGERSGGGEKSHAVVLINDLREGMVLAEDLYSEGGIKLLKRGTTLTDAALETIRRRHRFEPITRGAAVLASA